jgi:hypothetical protein
MGQKLDPERLKYETAAGAQCNFQQCSPNAKAMGDCGNFGN